MMGVLAGKNAVTSLKERSKTSYNLSESACYCSKLTSPCDNYNFTNTIAISDKTTDVVQALLSLTERCFNLANEMIHSIGVTSPSPLTLLRIINQAQPLFKEGGHIDFNLSVSLQRMCIHGVRALKVQIGEPFCIQETLETTTSSNYQSNSLDLPQCSHAK